jgi:NAD(P)-dependent dehydrogenase (short-subunit alcohol dehydrogenase family)
LTTAFYAASKAALDVYTSVLRIELAPFGVGVLLIMAGAVETPMNNASSTTTSSYTLPSQDSIFYPARTSIPKAKLGRRMKPDEFAEKVVRDVLAGKTGVTWRGAFASLAWFLLTFCPVWVMDKLTSDGTGLGLLGRK